MAHWKSPLVVTETVIVHVDLRLLNDMVDQSSALLRQSWSRDQISITAEAMPIHERHSHHYYVFYLLTTCLMRTNVDCDCIECAHLLRLSVRRFISNSRSWLAKNSRRIF